jgi:hypothetical protein
VRRVRLGERRPDDGNTPFLSERAERVQVCGLWWQTLQWKAMKPVRSGQPAGESTYRQAASSTILIGDARSCAGVQGEGPHLIAIRRHRLPQLGFGLD